MGHSWMVSLSGTAPQSIISEFTPVSGRVVDAFGAKAVVGVLFDSDIRMDNPEKASLSQSSQFFSQLKISG